MFKLMGKEINAILGEHTILIWTYANYIHIGALNTWPAHIAETSKRSRLICAVSAEPLLLAYTRYANLRHLAPMDASAMAFIGGYFSHIQ